MPLWARRCLTVACLLAAWLVVRPAAAAAPVCDERAASALAPSPVLDTSDASVDVGEHADDCDTDGSGDKTYQRGERPARSVCAAHADVIPPTPACRVPGAAVAVFVAPETQTAGHPGVYGTLERPPRG